MRSRTSNSLKQLLNHLREMRRDNSPELRFVISPVTIDIRNYVLEPSLGSTGDVLTTVLRYEAKIGDDHGGTEIVEGSIGTLELLECAAWLLEKRIVQAVDPSKQARRPRLFPYLIVEEFCRYEVPALDEDEVLVCVLAALQSSDAISALMELLVICRRALASGRGAVEVIRSCTKCTLAESRPRMETQFARLEEEFSGDGIMAVAIRRIVEVARGGTCSQRRHSVF